MDYNSTIRRMKKFLPSVRVLRSQFESKNIIIQNEPQSKGGVVAKSSDGKDPSGSVRKWKSTSNFHQQDSVSSTEAERSRSRSSSMGSLDEITSTSSGCSTSGKSNQSVTMTDQQVPKKDQSASIISLIQPIMLPGTSDSEKDYDMYRPRHSTAQWNPVGIILFRKGTRLESIVLISQQQLLVFFLSQDFSA